MEEKLHPFLPITRPLSKTQTQSKWQYSESIDRFQYSEELKSSLGFGKYLSIRGVSHLQIYEVASIVSDGDAAMLLHAGYHDRSSVIEYLTSKGMQHLIIDSSELVAQALDRRIPAFGYLTSGEVRRSSSPHLLDALEVSSSTALGRHTALFSEVLSGAIPLAMIKEAGYGKLSKVSPITATKGLLALAGGTTALTVDGFIRGLEHTRYGPSFATDVIELGLLYGDQMISTISPSAARRMHEYLLENYADHDEAYKVGAIKFAGELNIQSMLAKKTITRQKEEVLALYETGATVEDVMDGTMRVEQALRIREGMPTSISSGLL